MAIYVKNARLMKASLLEALSEYVALSEIMDAMPLTLTGFRKISPAF